MDNNPFENLSIPASEPPDVVLESFVNELKSPLMSIKGWVKILSMDPDRATADRALDSISTIIEKLEHQKSKVNKYLGEIRSSS